MPTSERHVWGVTGTPDEASVAPAIGHDEAGWSPAGFLDLLSSPACLLDGAGRIVHLNSAWAGLRGGCGSEDRATFWPQLIHAEDRYLAIGHHRSVAMSGREAVFECRLELVGGAARWFQVSLQPLGIPHGRGQRWSCICLDIEDSKRRQIELEMRASIQNGMLDVSLDCIKLVALDGSLIHMNKAGCEALGVTPGQFGMAWVDLLPEDTRPEAWRALEVARSGATVRFAGRSVVPGEQPQYWDNSLTPVTGANGEPTAILCVSRDVTAESRAREALQESQERLAIATRVGGLGIWDYDIVTEKLECDEAWYRIMGRSSDQPVGCRADFAQWIHPEDVERATEVYHTAAELIAADRDYSTMFRIVRPDGEIRWVRSAAALLLDESGAAVRAVGFVMDVTEARLGEQALRDVNRQMEAEMSALARQTLEDPLTGIANRRSLDGVLARLCMHTDGSNDAICIGMVDIDHFKAYNDRYGHLEGDAALRRVARALRSAARQQDFVARFGGEEFVFVIPATNDPRPMLERLTAAIRDLSIEHADSPSGFLTVSCGCAVMQSCGGRSPKQLLELCDEALYEAKRAGRSRYVVHGFDADGFRTPD